MQLGPNQQAWVNALRSGHFKQGVGFLQDSSGYCCLGVACAIAGDHVDLKFDNEGKIDGLDLTYQPPVTDRLGLKSGTGHVDEQASDPDGLNKALLDLLALSRNREDAEAGLVPADLSLTSLNDTHKLTFDEIADFVELYPDLYFKESK